MPGTHVCSRVDTIAMAKRLALYFTKKKDHQTPLSSVLRRTGWIIPFIKLSVNLLKRDSHHLTCQSITHRKELSGDILLPLLPKKLHSFLWHQRHWFIHDCLCISYHQELQRSGHILLQRKLLLWIRGVVVWRSDAGGVYRQSPRGATSSKWSYSRERGLFSR